MNRKQKRNKLYLTKAYILLAFIKKVYSSVVEHPTFNRIVVGSNPIIPISTILLLAFTVTT